MLTRYTLRYVNAGTIAEIYDESERVVVMDMAMNGPEDDATIQAICEDMNDLDGL